jgi:putative addiction module component (TIGR02574 family)
MTKTEIRERALELAPDDRRDLAETLWSSLELEPATLPDWQRALLDERLSALERQHDPGMPWANAEEEIWPKDE